MLLIAWWGTAFGSPSIESTVNTASLFTMYTSKADQRAINNTIKYLKILSASRYKNHGCGNWRGKYIKMHNDILAGKLPPRYLVSIPPPQGLADRLAGISAQFLIAYFNKRAMLFASTPETPGIDTAFDFPNIQSALPADFMKGQNEQILLNLTFDEYPPSINRDKSCPLYLNAGANVEQYPIVHKRNVDLFTQNDLRHSVNGCEHAETIYVTGNRGFSWSIFDNPHHKSELKQMGLRRETTFRCVIDFLLQLKPSACGTTCQQIKTQITTARDQGVIIIGIQVRVGDNVFEPGFNLSAIPDPSRHHLACANKLSNRFRMIGKTVKYFFISDSQALRTQIKLKLGNQVFTDDNFTPSHIHESQSGFDSKARALAGSASDIYLFSLAHIHVISKTSGFGQKAAFLSDASNKIHIFFGDDGVNCSLTKYSVDSATQWSGV